MAHDYDDMPREPRGFLRRLFDRLTLGYTAYTIDRLVNDDIDLSAKNVRALEHYLNVLDPETNAWVERHLRLRTGRQEVFDTMKDLCAFIGTAGAGIFLLSPALLPMILTGGAVVLGFGALLNVITAPDDDAMEMLHLRRNAEHAVALKMVADEMKSALADPLRNTPPDGFTPVVVSSLSAMLMVTGLAVWNPVMAAAGGIVAAVSGYIASKRKVVPADSDRAALLQFDTPAPDLTSKTMRDDFKTATLDANAEQKPATAPAAQQPAPGV